jgi:hypothetical protein
LDNHAQPVAIVAVAIVAAAIGPVVEMKSVASGLFSSVEYPPKVQKEGTSLKKTTFTESLSDIERQEY